MNDDNRGRSPLRTSETDTADTALDDLLRRCLDPPDEMTTRVVRRALAHDTAPSDTTEQRDAPHHSTPRTAWPWLAAAALLALVWAWRPGSHAPPLPVAGSTVTTMSTPNNAEVPARLRITNEGGPIVVTTTSGSRMILLTSNGATP